MDVSPTGGGNVRISTRPGHLLLALGFPIVPTSLKIANLRLKCSEAFVILSASRLGSPKTIAKIPDLSTRALLHGMEAAKTAHQVKNS